MKSDRAADFFRWRGRAVVFIFSRFSRWTRTESDGFDPGKHAGKITARGDFFPGVFVQVLPGPVAEKREDVPVRRKCVVGFAFTDDKKGMDPAMRVLAAFHKPQDQLARGTHGPETPEIPFSFTGLRRETGKARFHPGGKTGKKGRFRPNADEISGSGMFSESGENPGSGFTYQSEHETITSGARPASTLRTETTCAPPEILYFTLMNLMPIRLREAPASGKSAR